MTPWQECSIFRYTIFTHDQSFSYFCQFKCKGLIQPTNHSKCLPLNLCDGFEWRWGNSGGCWLTKMVLSLQTTVWQPKMVKFFHVVLNSKNKWLCCVSISGCVPRHFLSGLKLERNNYGSVIIKQNETTRCVLLPSLQIHLISLPYLCFFFGHSVLWAVNGPKLELLVKWVLSLTPMPSWRMKGICNTQKRCGFKLSRLLICHTRFKESCLIPMVFVRFFFILFSSWFCLHWYSHHVLKSSRSHSLVLGILGQHLLAWVVTLTRCLAATFMK